jgi:hypothetical protein
MKTESALTVLIVACGVVALTLSFGGCEKLAKGVIPVPKIIEDE